ncbi:MAG: hypothetical protein AB7H93_22690 [Vicinamibacterales bacterium]
MTAFLRGRRALVIAVVLLVGVAGGSTAGAQVPPVSPSLSPLVAPIASPKNPYATLFLLPGQSSPRTAPRVNAPSGVRTATTSTTPTVVCGTRLVPIDPSIDAGIRRVPDPAAPRPAGRVVEPRLCR